VNVSLRSWKRHGGDIARPYAAGVNELGLLPGARGSLVGSGPTTEVLRWPLDAAERPALRAARRPCLWLLERGELVPELDDLEDWVRLPVEPATLHERMQRLAARAGEAGGLLPGEVRVDPDGLLVFGPARVVVPRIEATILNRLGESPDRVVRRDQLIELLWHDDPRSPRAIDSRIHTLRVRVDPLGLQIHTIRRQGYVLARRPHPSTDPAIAGDAPRSNPWSS
jgi:hypothetical protein